MRRTAMEMPKPTPEHDRLKKFAGRWKGAEKLSPSPWDPAGGTATGTAENRIVLDGFAMIQDYVQVRDGYTSFRGHGVLAYDAHGKCYTMHWFDSMGTPPNVYKGNFEGEVLKLSSTFPGGYSRCAWDLGMEGEYRFTLDVSGDGEHWTTMMDGRYAKED
jgi:hypothetical protein